MRKQRFHIILFFLTAMLLSSCRVNRFVPEGKYFLHKNTVEVDRKQTEFTKSEVSSYIIQKTHKVRFPTRFPTWLYYVTENNSGSGFKHWVNEHLSRKPEYFDASEVSHSARQMEQYLDNRGYFNSKVTAKVDYKDKRARVTYTIHPGEPYHISKIDYQVEDTALWRALSRIEPRFPAQVNQVYNAYTLDQQRTTITNFLRNAGYYYFTR